MIRLFPLLAVASSCATPNAAVPSPAAEVRPVVAQDNLQGRWTITAVNGQPATQLWLELGAERIGPITTVGNAVYIGTPSPPTTAYLGCNWLRLNGWTRNGDKLILGIEGSRMTERGCGSPIDTAREKAAHAILRLPMTMELTPPDRLRLINEAGTLDLVRSQGMN